MLRCPVFHGLVWGVQPAILTTPEQTIAVKAKRGSAEIVIFVTSFVVLSAF